MKLYAHSYRRKPGTEKQLPYKRGPFASMDEWKTFRYSKHGRKMELCYALVDEETNPPTYVHSYGFRSVIPLPYPLLIRHYDGALITGNGKVIFSGPSEPS